jgi:type I restriction enzyme S subunit
MPEQFRETEVGLIPSNWRVVDLKKIAESKRDTVDPTEILDTPYVSLGHIDTGDPTLRRWGSSTEVKSSKKHFLPGDVLYGKLRPYLDKAALAEMEGVASTDIIVLKGKEGRTLPRFILYSLHTGRFLEYAISTTTGTNLPRTRWTAIRDYKIPLPPLPEQRRIAAALRTIQDAIAAQDDVIAAARELKRSLMARLFTYGPGPDPAPTQETEIGEIPEHWVISTVGDLASLVNSGLTPRGGKEVYQDYGIPFIRSQNVLMNYLSLDDVAFIPEAMHKDMSHSHIQPDDILLNITGASIGRVAKVPKSLEEANVNQHVCRIRFDDNAIDPQFAEFYLATPRAQNEIMGSQYGTTRQGLNYGQVKMLHIALPPQEEQKAVARILSYSQAKIAAEEQRKAALTELFRSTLEQLMTGQIRLPA